MLQDAKRTQLCDLAPALSAPDPSGYMNQFLVVDVVAKNASAAPADPCTVGSSGAGGGPSRDWIPLSSHPREACCCERALRDASGAPAGLCLGLEDTSGANS